MESKGNQLIPILQKITASDPISSIDGNSKSSDHQFPSPDKTFNIPSPSLLSKSFTDTPNKILSASSQDVNSYLPDSNFIQSNLTNNSHSLVSNLFKRSEPTSPVGFNLLRSPSNLSSPNSYTHHQFFNNNFKSYDPQQINNSMSNLSLNNDSMLIPNKNNDMSISLQTQEFNRTPQSKFFLPFLEDSNINCSTNIKDHNIWNNSTSPINRSCFTPYKFTDIDNNINQDRLSNDSFSIPVNSVPLTSDNLVFGFVPVATTSQFSWDRSALINRHPMLSSPTQYNAFPISHCPARPESVYSDGNSSYSSPIGSPPYMSQKILKSLPANSFNSQEACKSISTNWASVDYSRSIVDRPIQNYNEPLNYRRLLDRDAIFDWKFIVDKIVESNDQQASIFLQQKLKIGSIDQKHLIINAIIEKSYLLMINRFGNFLIQRCFEHGTKDQINSILSSIHGNVVKLSTDAFGCHVIQKALDFVNENDKLKITTELLQKARDTITHRYACHVWQKLFELRWNQSPLEIMKFVNNELKGSWTEVALGETGSLVVQNIFENCLEEEKRPCLDEVISNLDIIAKGQWGNWVVQHMIEHGELKDKESVLKVVIDHAEQYSIDQFASKVVEKALKCGNESFIERYLNKVCEPSPDRPRIPLIAIASDAYGNYLIQYILQHSTPAQRLKVSVQIRKHMVSLRGSKWGSKCAWIVERYRNEIQNSSHIDFSDLGQLNTAASPYKYSDARKEF